MQVIELFTLLCKGGGTRYELAKQTGMHYQTVCRYIRNLSAKGVIETSVDKNNERVFRIKK